MSSAVLLRVLFRYLKQLVEKGLIEIKELTKGVDHITSVDRNHEEYVNVVYAWFGFAQVSSYLRAIFTDI